MRRDVIELRQFYASPLGRAAREMLTRKVVEAWGDARGMDVLGLGYATPVLEALKPLARRTVAAMPAEQGVEAWPSGGRNLAALSGETSLPFANAIFDRVLIVHGLEEADDPLALLRETWRVMAPSGRVILAAASRRGLWANSESTRSGSGVRSATASWNGWCARRSWSRSPGHGRCMRRRPPG
jgi:SAM-dependent methyltransferase